VDLIPQRLRIDHQDLARHHPDLPFEREMIGIFRDGDADPKLRGITTARQDLCGAGCRHDGTVTMTAILLADVVLDLIRELDRGDPLGRFDLAHHFLQLAAARRALSIVGLEFVPNLHRRQCRLRPRPVSGLSRPRCDGHAVRCADASAW
jgi:hypothetical protein